jgi:hypothetical protein
MRRGLLVAVVVLLLGALFAAGQGVSAVPSLRLVEFAPLTLRGSGFSTGERVRVSIAVRRLHEERTLRTDAAGRFTFRYSTLVALDPCRGTIVVTAVGTSSGRTATWKRQCRPPELVP